MYYLSPDIFVKADSPKGGVGVFAKRDIPANTLLEISPVSNSFRSNWENTPYHLKKIVFSFPMNTDNYAIALGYISIYNHEDNNNACWYTCDIGVGVYTRLEIKKGEEIFINYGPNYWKNGWPKI